MRHRRSTRSHEPRAPIVGESDLFAYAQRQAPSTTDDELWSMKIVRMKTGLSRASVYKYMALGLFPRQRHLGPGRVAWRASDVRTWIDSRPE
jgi:prophage regulatory protein